jgi:predicted TIM-barrel fold metal-dependent hydrolase
MDLGLGARGLERIVKAGTKGAMLRAHPSGARPYGHPDNDVLWATAQDLSEPVGLHIGDNRRFAGHELFDITLGAGTWWIYNMFAVYVQIGLMSLMHGSVFQRYPGLTVTLLESGCGWVGFWLDRMDKTFHHLSFSTPLDEQLSEYFKR